jgi:predicted negative regulator of RcsB-dependent stress response
VTGGASGQDSQQFLEDRRAAARQLIEEGDALYQRGDAGGARRKWQEAVGKAPGTPERDAAMQRIEQVQTTPNFEGG